MKIKKKLMNLKKQNEKNKILKKEINKKDKQIKTYKNEIQQDKQFSLRFFNFLSVPKF